MRCMFFFQKENVSFAIAFDLYNIPKAFFPICYLVFVNCESISVGTLLHVTGMSLWLYAEYLLSLTQPSAGVCG